MSIKDSLIQRFVNYASIMTPSNDESDTVPTSRCQFNLANVLVEELKAMGVDNAYVDSQCYVYGSIPATKGYEDKPAIGFIAHMDTVSDYTSEPVCPIVSTNYNGHDIHFENGRVLSSKDFPHLPGMNGRTLITSNGNTILGADDKAGVAEIITMAEELINSGKPHGKICIGFTPDEEVGRGADHFNIKGFGAKYAYTVDGGEEGSIEYENFNAASAEFTVTGKGVHPGSAKDIMVNASLVIMEINSMIPENETPATTEGYEGFYHLCEVKGSVEEASSYYIVRDHDADSFQKRLDYLNHIVDVINEKYGMNTVKVEIVNQYRNMKEMIEPHYHLIENANAAIVEAGLTPITVPIRGGTDGARLSYEGLPCPNLGTGGFGFHGPYEHITAEGMESVVKILLGIVTKYAEF